MEFEVTKCDKCGKKMIVVKGVCNVFTIIALCTECSPSQKITTQCEGDYTNGIIGVPIPQDNPELWQVRMINGAIVFRRKEEV